MLKILAPFKEKREVVPLIDAGANELYCGYLAPEWVTRYSSLEFERKGGDSNFRDLKELKQSVKMAHQRNVPVFLTLNGLYVHAQYPLLLKILDQLKKIDLDGYIVADLGLLLTLRERGYEGEIHISTLGTVFNSEAVRFYKQMGAVRIVLDRQTSFRSMKILCQQNPEINFEAFVLYNLCTYIDGFCTFLHAHGIDAEGLMAPRRGRDPEEIRFISSFDIGTPSDACFLKYSVRALQAKSNKEIHGVQPTFYKRLIDGVECGACAVYDIQRTGVKTLKVVGRQLSAGHRLKGTTFVRRVLSLLDKNRNITKKDFIDQTQKLYQETYQRQDPCRGNNCYHPEVLWPRKR